MKRILIISAIIVTAAVVATVGFQIRESPRDAAAVDEQAEAETEAASGPHGGRLLRDGETSVEIMIVENGFPPELRLYAYRDHDPVDPARVSATVQLDRLGGKRDALAFLPESDYLRSDGAVREPHSFDVRLDATIDGREHVWSYESHEGRTEISPRIAEASGIVVESAGPARIVETSITRRPLSEPSATSVPLRSAHMNTGPLSSLIRSVPLVNARLSPSAAEASKK